MEGKGKRKEVAAADGAEPAEQLVAGKSLYDILQVTNTSSASEIKRAYYKLALRYHPDKVEQTLDASASEEQKAAQREQANRNFQALGKAYDTLSDHEKRAFYDETGSILGEDMAEDMFKEGASDKNWTAYWRALFHEVTLDEVKAYEKNYKGSAIERDDVVQAYTICEGDMDRIMQNVILCTWEDEERFINIIQESIAKGELEALPKFKKTTTKAARRKRQKKAQKEAVEAEELANALGINGHRSSGEDPEAALKAIVAQRRSMQDSFEDLVASLEAKYGGGQASNSRKRKQSKREKHEQEEEEEEEEEVKEEKGRKGSKGRSTTTKNDRAVTKRRKVSEAEEPTEEEFQAARKRVEARRQSQAASKLSTKNTKTKKSK
ncbi:DnaJ subfamily C member 9 [Balamuthia mandrillaris]